MIQLFSAGGSTIADERTEISYRDGMQSPVPTMQSQITNTSGRIRQLKSRCSSVENTDDQLLPGSRR